MMPHGDLRGVTVDGLYEIIHELGSGGGGVVYLAQHKRLGKLVAVKADKRKLNTKPEVLRREVDTMKDLSHTYIPKVYDFVVENDTVYTVMDYVEGESLDKPLNRDERFSQPQIIEWTKQLLGALDYLHNRPPHGILHSDIKPANIMVTPQGDIRLIDFNIALALGEEGAVRVGLSRGYASPEHYGLDYSAAAATQMNDSAETVLEQENGRTRLQDGSSSNPSKRAVCLDVRSDIYSLGATLYHLLTGQKPAQDAKDVAPISTSGVSPEVVSIVRKAMAPDPDQRYQSAQEMLAAFEHLHENDPRTKRHKRRITVTAAVLAALFLAGGVCSLAGLRQMQQAEAEARLEAEAAEEAERRAKELEQAEKTALAAVRDSEQRYQAGDIPGAIGSALAGLSEQTRYQAQAQKALTDALGVYELSGSFRSHLLLELPGQPMKAVLSPSGTRAAVLANSTVLVYDTDDGKELARLPAERSALSDIVFSGENIVIYAGQGGIQAYDVAEQRELWSGGTATGIALSADGSTVAAVDRDAPSAIVYSASDGTQLRSVDFCGLKQPVPVSDIFVDPEDALFSLNRDGTMLAASFSNGALWIFDLRSSENDIELYDQSEFTHFEGGFSGQYFTFSASDGVHSVMAALDMAELTQTGGLEAAMDIHMQVDESGVYAAAGRLVTQLDPLTFEEREQAYASYAADSIQTFWVGGNCTILATQGGGFALFDHSGLLLNVWETDTQYNIVDAAGEFALAASWDTPALRILKRETHPDAQLFSYDGGAPHSEARISADGSVAMLFRYDGFQLYGKDGTILAEQAVPDAEQVYDQQYRRAEGYLEIIYNDGLIRRYSAEDGRLLYEEHGEAPDETMYEEFFTDKLRITSPLHGTPAAYDRETGDLVRELEEDAYLTYVTQVGEYIITQYVSTQNEGDRYGLLLNADCETLARLPGLCDILEDGTLVFDDDRGNLRQSRIYSTQELTALGERVKGGAQ